jgi:hypothetical protein
VKTSRLRLGIQILAGVLIFVAIGCVAQGIIAVLGNAQSVPSVISCAQLGGNGPGGNGHVTVTDFHACTDMIVVSGGDGKTNWDEAFIPLVPTSDPDNKNFRVLLDTHEVSNPDALDKLNSGGSVTGIINNAAQGPDDKAKDLLKGSYSGVDLDKVYVVQHDMTAISRIAGTFLLIAGVVLFAASVFLLKKMPAAKTAALPAGPVSEKF